MCEFLCVCRTVGACMNWLTLLFILSCLYALVLALMRLVRISQSSFQRLVLFIFGLRSRISIASRIFRQVTRSSIARMVALKTGVFSTGVSGWQCFMWSPHGVFFVLFLASAWCSCSLVRMGRWLSPTYFSQQSVHFNK